MFGGGFEQGFGLVGGERVDGAGLAEGDVDLFGDVARQDVFTHGVGEGGDQDAVDVVQGAFREELVAAVALGAAALAQ